MAAAAEFAPLEMGVTEEGRGHLRGVARGQTSSRLTPAQQRRQQHKDARATRVALEKQQRQTIREAKKMSRDADKSTRKAAAAAAKGDKRTAAMHSAAALAQTKTAADLHAAAANIGLNVGVAQEAETAAKEQVELGAQEEREGRALQRAQKKTDKRISHAEHTAARVASLQPGYRGPIVTKTPGRTPGLYHRLTGRSWARGKRGGRTNRRRRSRRRTKHRRRHNHRRRTLR